MRFRLPYGAFPGTLPDGWRLLDGDAENPERRSREGLVVVQGDGMNKAEANKATAQLWLTLEMLIGALDGFDLPQDEAAFAKWEDSARALLTEMSMPAPPEAWPVAARRGAYRRMLTAALRPAKEEE